MATIQRKRGIYNSKDIKVNWDTLSKSPWISYQENDANKQIYFENERSVIEKVKFIKENNLGGVGIWALGYEDSVDPFLTIEREINIP